MDEEAEAEMEWAALLDGSERDDEDDLCGEEDDEDEEEEEELGRRG